MSLIGPNVCCDSSICWACLDVELLDLIAFQCIVPLPYPLLSLTWKIQPETQGTPDQLETRRQRKCTVHTKNILSTNRKVLSERTTT
jgi:hypothetical protein